MNAPVTTRTFMNGNSVVLRLPRALGVGPDEIMEIDRRGTELIVRRSVDPAAEKAKLRALLAELDALPVPGDIEVRDTAEIPERPGL
jgi:virulence-associated protein VagC